MAKQLTIPEQHQLRIAIDTIKNPMKALLGPPSVEEAKEIVFRLTGKRIASDSITTDKRARMHRTLDRVLDSRRGAARDGSVVIYADTMQEVKRIMQELRLNGVILPQAGKAPNGKFGVEALTSRTVALQAIKAVGASSAKVE